MQTKKKSLKESIINTSVGFVLSFIIQLIIYPLFDIPVSFSQNVWITIIFTVVSILRGYVVRRLFNKKT
jgi:uncharacterized protein YacL